MAVRPIPVCVLILALLAPVAGRAADKEKAQKNTSPFMELPTLTASVIRSDGRRGVLTVQASLYIPNAPQRAKAAQSMPLLLNAFVPALQTWAFGLPPGTKPNVDGLSSGLQRATDGVLGGGARVLLGGVMVN